MSTTELSLVGRSPWALLANSLTVSRIVATPLLTMLILERNPWWVTFWLGIALAFTDFLDGRVARRAVPTRAGAFLDPLADKIVVLAAGYALVAIGRFSWIPITLIAARELAIMAYRSYWGRRGLAIPARQSAKYKTVIQGLALAAATCPPLEGAPWVADGLLWIAVAFTLYTGIQYALDGRAALRTTGAR
jgi:CDP-diacylglycerol--glycerol-3-phosphate 3-phosphatidyltransferase